jgi:hypothetical protein
MSGRQRKIAHLALLLAFLLVAETIDLFHTDGIFGQDPSCPACTFHNTAVSAVPCQIFQLPALVVMEVVSFPTPPSIEELFFLTESARAPPLA